MRLDIEGKHMTLAPHLMGWIAERLQDLNTSYDDICEARVTFIQQSRRDAVCIDLLLLGQSLHVTQRGVTPDAAVDAAFRVIQQQLCDVRTARQARTSLSITQKSTRTSGSVIAGEAAHSTPQT